jgi:preprotein translocase subunit SecE
MVELPTFTAPKFSGSPSQFLKDVRLELKKVKWPSQKAVTKMTIMVIGVSLAMSLFISSLDFILTKLTEVFVR